MTETTTKVRDWPSVRIRPEIYERLLERRRRERVPILAQIDLALEAVLAGEEAESDDR